MTNITQLPLSTDDAIEKMHEHFNTCSYAVAVSPSIVRLSVNGNCYVGDSVAECVQAAINAGESEGE